MNIKFVPVHISHHTCIIPMQHSIGKEIYTLTLWPRVRSLRQYGAVEGSERLPEPLNVHFNFGIHIYVTLTHFNVPGTLLGLRHPINTFQNNSRTFKTIFQKPVKSTGRTISIDRSNRNRNFPIFQRSTGRTI